MKIASIVPFVTVLVGCAEKNIAVKILARHAGVEIAEKWPEAVDDLKSILTDIVENEAGGSENLTAVLMDVLSANILRDLDDPLSVADVQDLLGNRIPEIKIEADRIQLIKTAVRGMIEGLEIGR